MKIIALTCLANLSLASLSLAGLPLTTAAFAQEPAKVSATPAPAATTTAPDLTKDGKPSAKSVRKECRVSVKSEGLKGDERRKAISDCFIKQRPDLAAKEQCRMDAKAKGLAKGDERKAFIKNCVKAKG